MPVHIQICCEGESCEACVSCFWSGTGEYVCEELMEKFDEKTCVPGKYPESGRSSRGPPSRERETWILVSLVSRAMKAVRGDFEEAIEVSWTRGCSL